jgi:hypothetical protein
MKQSWGLVGLAWAVLCICASGSFAARPDSLKLNVYRSAVDSVAGWTEQRDGFHSFGTKELYELIDGGAVEYEKPGLVAGIVTELTASGTRSAKIYIEDFGTQARSQSMVKAKRKTASEPKPLAGAPKNSFTDEVIGGCLAYASSGNFYFELVLTGYDRTENAVTDAGEFLGILNDKTNPKPVGPHRP